MQRPPQAPVGKIPKDGVGPRGKPECYYTSRVLNSTARYVRFVRKLRAEEEDQRKGAANKLKELKDLQNSDFFIRCDRRALINNVARRVDLCMASYQRGLQEKRNRLIELYSAEEEANIRAFVSQAQAGAEQVWSDKRARLTYLLDKRRREHEERFKDTPLSKCAHVLPCIYKLRAKEAEEIQLYQIKEKEARKMADKEFDRMWLAVAMKEADALKARMEIDAIERKRKDMECKQYTDYQLEKRREQQEREKKMLREEAIRFKAIWDQDIKNEEEAERKRTEKRMETARERSQMIKDRQDALDRQKTQEKLISDTWDSLAGQGLAAEHAKVELARKKERDLDECNRKMIELKQDIANMDNANDDMFKDEAILRQNMLDQKRCEYLLRAKKTNQDVRKGMIDQINDRRQTREDLASKLAQEDEYNRQLYKQLQDLVQHKTITDAEGRKKYQTQLLGQIEYNKVLRERARQEELDEIRKGQMVAEKYQQEINNMMTRPFFSDEVHPFMKQMAKGLQMREKCPCSKPDYCK